MAECQNLTGKVTSAVRLHAQFKSIDLERTILVPVLTLLLIASTVNLFAGGITHSSGEIVFALLLCYRILLTCFYLLFIALLIVRSAAKTRSERIVPRVAAYVATFLPFLIPFVGGSEPAPALRLIAVALMASGMLFTVYSLTVLGKSFGVVPQVRVLVQCGPYRFIRHPLYVGEVASLTGAILFSPSIPKAAILVAIAALQAYRSVQEERLFEISIPEYATYKRRTKRFVPGLF